MALDLNEVKINVRSLLTSSKDPVSIAKLRKDYYAQEGMNIPYRSLGFSSDIELLQSMTDVLSVPQNPNPSSILSLIVGEKTVHLKMLIDKQKPQKKKKTSLNNSHGNMHNRNTYNRSTRNSPENIVNNDSLNNSQNRNNYNNYSKSNKQYSYNNQRNQNGTQISGKSTESSKEYVRQSQYTNTNSFTKNGLNNYCKTSNSSKQFDFAQNNDKIVSSELQTNSKIIDHTSDILNNNLKMLLHKTENIPKKILFNIVKLFEVYNIGINIENFKFIYNLEYNTTFDPSTYGFSTAVKMFETLDELINIRNEVVLYTKPKFEFSKFYNIIDFNHDKIANQIDMLTDILQISLDIHEKNPIMPLTGKHKMVLVEAFNPSLFFLQLEDNIKDLELLTLEMKKFYESSDSSYLVGQEQIKPGLIYASFYNTYSDIKQWHRVRIIREVNAMTVEVIHVDYGTVDNIPKTEFRFLHPKFSKLACQAFHCCLDSYNELESIAPEVTEAFLEMTVGNDENKSVYVQFEKDFCLNSGYKIFHVTLFKNPKQKMAKKMINLNYELTMHHLHR